ncbi:MAG: hypothetical protein SynsKO_40190 [Synoicihabitans sp.]
MLAATLHAHERRLRAAKHAVETSLDGVLSQADLATAAGLSSNQLDRVFSRRWGETPRAMQRRLRLERAARQLSATPATVLEIALAAGYESHEAFTRAFADRYGRSPQEFRNTPGARAQPFQREKLWQQSLLAGLRPHAESNHPFV